MVPVPAPWAWSDNTDASQQQASAADFSQCRDSGMTIFIGDMRKRDTLEGAANLRFG